MKSLYDQIIQENNLSFITVTRTTNQITLKIDYTNLNYSIDSTENGWFINMESFGGNGQQGHPDLPYRTYTLELPANVIFSSINTTIDSIYSTAAGNYTPFKPVVIYADTIVLEEPNQEIYTTNANYPANPISITNPSNMRNWVFLGIELFPFQYNPVTGNLLKIDSIAYIINFEVSRDSIPKDSTKVSGYCIITTQTIKESSEKLEEFRLSKERIGFDCLVVTVDSLDTCNFTNLQAPGERPERIRRYLQENYIEKNIEYVLLIGNPDPDDQFHDNDYIGDVPMKMAYPERLDSFYDITPTDYYYSDLTGNWDLDGDEIFGENKTFSELGYVPRPSITNLNYSIKYEGYLIIPMNGTDTIKGIIQAKYDNGFRLWINDTLYNSSNNADRTYWSDSSSWNSIINQGETSLTQHFKSGLYKIKIEYKNTGGDGYLQLFFPLFTSYVQDYYKKLLPENWFYHYNNGNYYPGLEVTYYNDDSLSNSVSSQIQTSVINYDWTNGDKGIGGVDFLPEVIVGRIPIYENNIDTLDMILNRIINYQFNQEENQRRESLIITNQILPDADEDSIITVGEHINNLHVNNLFSTYRVYHRTWPNINLINLTIPTSYSNVLEVWNENNPSVVTWMSHGKAESNIYGQGVYALNIMNSTTCDQINRTKPAIVFEGSCFLGIPEYSYNLGYRLLKNNAVATISATRKGWGADKISDSLVQITVDATDLAYFFNKNLLDFNSVGSSFTNTKARNTTNICDWLNILTFNLYGEPSLSLFDEVQKIKLDAGYNLISSYMDVKSDSLFALFNGIKNKMSFIRNEDSLYYRPDSLNEIGAFNNKKAYYLYMQSSDSLFILGSPVVPENTYIDLKANFWNQLSYLRKNELIITSALDNIPDSIIVIVKNVNGQIYVPKYYINQIGNMKPGCGYLIYLTDSISFTYPQNSSSKSNLKKNICGFAQYLKPIKNRTGNNSTLIVKNLDLTDNYEIGIINTKGDLVGSGAVENNICPITIWGKNDIDNKTDGSLLGEILSPVLYNTSTMKFEDIILNNIKDIITGNYLNELLYFTDRIIEADATIDINNSTINNNFNMAAIPNPCNENTVISYTLIENTNVTLQITDNLANEVVRLVNNEFQQPGNYNYNLNSENLTNGIYYCNIFTDNNIETILILIIK